MSGFRNFFLRAGAALVLIVVLIVPPVAIGFLIGRPWPDLGVLRNEVSQGVLTSDTTMRVAATLFVLVWGWAVAVIFTEVWQIVRTRNSTPGSASRPTSSAVAIASSGATTGASGALHRLVRLALLGTVTTAATFSTLSSTAVALSAQSSAVGFDRAPGPVTAVLDPSLDTSVDLSSQSSTSIVVADGRQTPLSIAVDYGDESLRDEIIELNTSNEWSSGVFPRGMTVIVPAPEPPREELLQTAQGFDAEAGVDAEREANTDVVGNTPAITAETDAPPTEVLRYTVGENDGMWSVAEGLLGDGALHVELREQLVGQEVAPGVVFDTDTYTIHPGWVFTHPAHVEIATPSESSVAAEGAGASPIDVPDADGLAVSDDVTPIHGIPRAEDGEHGPADTTHIVEAGDTLSGIAGDHLGEQDDWELIWAENAGDDMGGGRSFDDPNLILPGWEIDVPVAESAAAPEPDAAEQPDEVELPEIASAEAAEVLPPPVVDTPSISQGSASDEITLDKSAIETAPTSTPPTAPASVPTTSVPAAAGAGDQAGPTERGESPVPAPSPIRLEHAALLAAGVLTLVGVRRRRALRSALPHARVPTPAPEIAATERRLRTIDPGERAARVDIAVRAIARHIAGTGTQVGTVRIAPDGELIARLTGAAHLGAPWLATSDTATPNNSTPNNTTPSSSTPSYSTPSGTTPDIEAGRTWTLPASVPIEMVSDDARQSGQPCLSLVTIGIDADGRDVLLDLEAAGLTSIEASPEQGDEVVRAIGSGLATSLASEVVHLLVAGLGTDVLFDHPNTRHLEQSADAVDVAARTVGSLLANERSAFDLRARRTGGEMWEPAIVLFAHTDDAAHTLAALPAAGHGIAAVAAVDPGAFDRGAADDGTGANTPGAVVRARTDHWQLDAFDERIELIPIGLSKNDVVEIAAVLDDASQAVEVAPPVHVDVNELVADPIDVIPHDIVVTMMGGVSVIDRDGNDGTFQRSKTVELIAWLATHRDRSTRSAARTALWELDVRDATFANVVSEARRALGRLVPPPDGEEWLARTLNESLPLHERVVTDADLIRQRVDHAQVAPPAHAIDVLRPAVEMIHGLPFAGSSYLWPDADGLTSNLVLLATTATAELAAHALSVGDTDLVFWSTGQGLKVLPGHEELIGLRMRAHARAGDLSGVRQEWESYERVINADSWSDGEPAPKLLDLRRQLLTPST